MLKSEALTILGLVDHDVIDAELVIDAYDEQLFEFRQYCLMNPVIEVLYKKRFDKLSRAFDAMNRLIPSEVSTRSAAVLSSNDGLSTDSLISSFEQRQSVLKTELGKLWFITDVAKWIENVVALQSDFEEILWQKVGDLVGEYPNWPSGYNTAGKISEGLNTVVINKTIKEISVNPANQEALISLLSEMYKLVKKRSLKNQS